jgi:hypothetical protein
MNPNGARDGPPVASRAGAMIIRDVVAPNLTIPYDVCVSAGVAAGARSRQSHLYPRQDHH